MLSVVEFRDIFAEEGAIVVPVNCQGVTGKGVAKDWADRFPAAKVEYQHWCRDGLLRPGDVARVVADNREHLLFATKDQWRNPSKKAWVERGIISLLEMSLNGIITSKTILLPAVGCGLGGLAWDWLKPVVEGAFAYNALPNDILFIAPLGVSVKEEVFA